MDEPDDDRPAEPGAAVDESVPPVDHAEPLVVPEADVFRFDRVDRAGGRIHSPGARRGLTLDFDARGIVVFGPKTGRHQSIRWSDVAWVSIGAPVVGPGGRTETPIDLESTDGLVRYLVRSEGSQAVAMAALEVQVDRWTAVDRVEPAPEAAAPVAVGIAPPPPPPPVRTPPAASVPPVAPPPGPVLYPPPVGPPGYAPPAPQALEAIGPFGPYSFDTSAPYRDYGSDTAAAPAAGKKRTRRTVTLVVALALVVGGVGLAFGLAATGTSKPPTKVAAPPPSSSDEHLAQRLLLTKDDLPVGWRASTNPGTNANSPALRQGEARITRALALCMGITDAEGAIVLGGQASDQTAQTSSPIFVAPTSDAAGTAVELQTAATVVRSHRDEEQDLALFANPKYPQCAATASAQELQLGVNQTSGGGDQAGPATVTPIDLPSASGVQLSGVLMDFTVLDGTATVHVQVESITAGAHRVEAGLEVFAIGSQIPNQALSPAISTFERRVASGGASSVV